MTCAERREDLSAYLDGELAPAALADFETHLAGCAECQATVAAQRRLAGTFATLLPVEPPGDFKARFWARIARDSDAPASWRARLFSRRWLLAAGGAAAAALAAVVGVRIRRSEVTDDADWQIVANGRDLEMLEDPDLELLEVVDVLEDWNGDPG